MASIRMVLLLFRKFLEHFGQKIPCLQRNLSFKKVAQDEVCFLLYLYFSVERPFEIYRIRLKPFKSRLLGLELRCGGILKDTKTDDLGSTPPPFKRFTES